MYKVVFPRRWEKVDREGNQYFRYVLKSPLTPKAILALNYEDIDRRMLRYYPLDFVRVTNDSPVDVELSISPTQDFKIPQGSITTITDRPITQIRLKNLDATTTIAEGKITFLFQRQPLTQDRLVRRRA